MIVVKKLLKEKLHQIKKFDRKASFLEKAEKKKT